MLKPNSHILQPHNPASFEKQALQVFRMQSIHTQIYKLYLKEIGCKPHDVTSIDQIPFLPITFFKTHSVLMKGCIPEKVFYSSGTTQAIRSKHEIVSLKLYEESFIKSFTHFFGNPKDYVILALLPSYLEQGNSSLVYMVEKLIEKSGKEASGFYLNDNATLVETLIKLDNSGTKTLLIGVSYALLDLIDSHQFSLKNTLVMETGGMKGRRKEMIKQDLHEKLKDGFGVNKIYSEYGMTELLSQAYSLGGQKFTAPSWMQIKIREVEDPFHFLPYGKTGGVNIIDLANYYSCSFIETQDLGKVYEDGSFEILGRFDHSDIRGCNLMIE